MAFWCRGRHPPTPFVDNRHAARGLVRGRIAADGEAPPRSRAAMADVDIAGETMPDASAEACAAVRRAVAKLLELTYPEVPADIRHRRARGGACVRKHLEQAAPVCLMAFNALQEKMAEIRCGASVLEWTLQFFIFVSVLLAFHVTFASWIALCCAVRGVAGSRCRRACLLGRPSTMFIQ